MCWIPGSVNTMCSGGFTHFNRQIIYKDNKPFKIDMTLVFQYTTIITVGVNNGFTVTVKTVILKYVHPHENKVRFL